MGHKVLVTYGSKYGATAEIAERVGQVLRENGLDVEVKPAGQVSDLTYYSAVILGSSVYFGLWRKEAAALLTDLAQQLAERPTWLFSSGPTGEGDPVDQMKGWRFPEGLQATADRIKPGDIAFFCGKIDLSKLGLFERWMVKALKAPVGDFRNWEAIESWAAGIARALQEKAN